MILGLPSGGPSKKNRTYAEPSALVALSMLLSGCNSALAPLQEPTRLYSEQEEIAQIKTAINSPDILSSINTEPARNNYITMRMYAIDLEYTNYEAQLTHSTQATDLLGTATTLALNGTATVIPVGQTTKVLSAFAGGVTGTVQAYDKEVLMSKAIQDLQAQMRTDRNNEAKIILANMPCDIETYPLGQALSDLELYYRAGTLASAEIGLSKTVGAAEAKSKDNKNSVNASPQISQPAKEDLKNAPAASGVPTPAAVEKQPDTSQRDCPSSSVHFASKAAKKARS